MSTHAEHSKTLVLVAGPLASGKSTLSKAIARQLGYACLNKDDIKEILGDTIGYANREENLKLSVATFSLMRHAMGRILDVTQGVVLESNFRDHEYRQFREDAIAREIRLVTLFVTADDDVLYERFKVRHPSRHHVHTSVGLPDRQGFTDWILRYSDVPYKDEAIVVDTTDFETVSVDAIVKAINAK
jgi:predicted kinase